MTRYLVIIEKAARNYSAYCPDLPGCVATGKTMRDVRRNIKAAISVHAQGLKESGLVVPPQDSIARFVSV